MWNRAIVRPRALSMFDPFADFGSHFEALNALHREMERLFSGYERAFSPSDFGSNEGGMQLKDTGANYVLSAQLPGIELKDTEVSVSGDTIVLRGKREVIAPEGYSVHRQERQSYQFERAFKLPTPVSADNVAAEMKHGILTITLPKSPEAQPKRISVKSQG